MIIFTLILCASLVALSGWAWWSAKSQMDKSHLNHLSSLASAKRSEEYHNAGNEMFEKALDSYKEGQQFWAAATEALLDAKRRERKVDDMVDQLKADGVIPFDFKAGEEAA